MTNNKDNEIGAWLAMAKILVGVYIGSYIFAGALALAAGGIITAAIIKHRR